LFGTHGPRWPWGTDPRHLNSLDDVRLEIARERVRDRRWKRRRSQLYVLLVLLAAIGLIHPAGLSLPL
jgi:hypothetical protein